MDFTTVSSCKMENSLQYDFPGAAETHIYGISDETGALSGNIVDASGVTHAFSGELIITFPGAVNTYGDFVNAAGAVVRQPMWMPMECPHGFIRNPDGSFTTIDLPTMPKPRIPICEHHYRCRVLLASEPKL